MKARAAPRAGVPRVAPLDTLLPAYGAFLEALCAAGFEGDISADDGTRAAAALDNSIYEMLPQAVVHPRGKADVERIMALLDAPEHRTVGIAARGGGTGTNGQSLTEGIVVDFARHMNHILEIDPERRIARVEPGVVKDQLNRALAPHGLFFAPELSTSDRATIGGMISTDASGQGSVIHGKTRDHVRALTTVFLGGTALRSEAVDDGGLDALCARQDRVGDLHRTARRISLERRDEIRARFPRLNRALTGYDLAHLHDDRGRFDLNSLICGAEGTLGLVVDAELSVLPVPAETGLVVLGYQDIGAALAAPGPLLALGASSVEFMDGTILDLARGDAVWLSVGRFFGAADGSPVGAVNVLEFLADTPADLDARIAAARRAIAQQGDARILSEARGVAEVGAVWAMRKKAVGLLGNLPGEDRPVPFVEDAAVPPERLGAFIAGFRRILDQRDVRYGMFGHADAGVVHVRPALDMRSPDVPAQVRAISDAVAALARQHSGVLWGEHGKGLRSEYAPEVFGPLYDAVCEIKRVCDPRDQLNPGKVAAPDGPPRRRIDEVPMRGRNSAGLPDAIVRSTGNALRCNGNGACHSFDADTVMCPSWRGTRDRRHTPKGRANLMERWLRGYVAAGGAETAITDPYRAPPRRRLDLLCAGGDFAHAVHEAMDGCLACKGCSGQCPVRVDVPGFRAAFLQAYHARYPRPLSDLAVRNLEPMLPRLARLAPLAVPALRGPLPRFLGLVDLPLPPRRGLAARARDRGMTLRPAGDARAPDRGPGVILVQDVFTTIFEPDLVLDTVELLERLGVRTFLAPLRENGKPLHVRGLLTSFARVAADTARELRRLAETGLPLVGIDPSMTLVYRSEYVDALGADAAPRVRLLQEWLTDADLTFPAPSADAPAVLLPHCTETALAPRAAQSWQAILERFGVTAEMPAAGCCGMAGLYGHERRHRAISARIFDLSWRPKVDDRSRPILATGYSCREQILRESNMRVEHPVSYLLRALLG